MKSSPKKNKTNTNKNLNTYKCNFTLLFNNLCNAKVGDDAAILFFIDKYNPLIKKYAFSYKLKDYEVNDLIQIGNLAIITAINKYDLARGAEYIDSYIINSIKNSFKNLARNQIKYNSESSINITIDEDSEISDLIEDSFNLENHIIDNMINNTLKEILSTLSPNEYDLIRFAYLTPETNLFKYCKTNNLNYPQKRRQLIALLSKLRNLLDF